MPASGDSQRKRSSRRDKPHPADRNSDGVTNSKRNSCKNSRYSSSRTGSNNINSNNESSSSSSNVLRGLNKKANLVKNQSSIVSKALRVMFLIGCVGALVSVELSSLPASQNTELSSSRALRGDQTHAETVNYNNNNNNKKKNKNKRNIKVAMADESIIGLVEQTITELESVIIAASTDLKQTSSTSSKRTKCVKLSQVQQKAGGAYNRHTQRRVGRRLLRNDVNVKHASETEGIYRAIDGTIANNANEKDKERGDGSGSGRDSNVNDNSNANSNDGEQDENKAEPYIESGEGEAGEDNESSEDNDDGDTEIDDDDGDRKSMTGCKENEVLVTEGQGGFGEDDFEDAAVVDEFYKDLDSRNEFNFNFKSIGNMPDSFQVLQIAKSLNNPRDEDDTGLKHHVRDPMFGNADPEEEELSSPSDDDDNTGGDKHAHGTPNEKIFIAPRLRAPDADFLQFRALLRQGRTFSHTNKYPQLERALKQVGYKQSAKQSKKPPFWLGHPGDTCPSLPKGEQHITFCLHHMPWYREHEQYALLQKFEDEHPLLKEQLPVSSFFPPTFRLFKGADRRELKARIADESLPLEGGPYVTKFTYAHGAGVASLTVKMWDLLKKSDHSTAIQVKEAKQRKIVQYYVNDPYLFEERKFIVRNWAVIVSVDPLIVYFKEGALYRSMENYTPFVKRDASYKRATHFTNAQSSHKGSALRSSSLYSSLGQFQKWLSKTGKEKFDFVKRVLKPQMRARMMYAVKALLHPAKGSAAELDGHTPGKRGALPLDSAALQQISFDFLLDSSKKPWLLGVNTGVNSYVSFGGEGFRPQWKIALQESFTSKFVDLGEEMLWRKLNKQPMSTLKFFTDTKLKILIDESIAGWDTADRIMKCLQGQSDPDGMDDQVDDDATDDDDAGDGSSNARVGDTTAGDDDIENGDGDGDGHSSSSSSSGSGYDDKGGDGDEESDR